MTRHANEFDWNDEAVERLRKMSDEGYTGGQIAQVWGVTRNIICAKINRLGLKRGVPSDVVKMAATVRDTSRKSRAQCRAEGKPRVDKPKPKHQPLPTLSEPAKPRALPPAEAMTETAVATIDLQSHHCRWIITADAPFLHCGAQKVAGYSWCAEHRAKAFSNGTRSEREAA